MSLHVATTSYAKPRGSFRSTEKGAVDRYWIDGALPRISVGKTQRASIAAGLAIEKEGTSTRHFDIVWLQSTTLANPIHTASTRKRRFASKVWIRPQARNSIIARLRCCQMCIPIAPR